jgi:hypothetical protein
MRDLGSLIDARFTNDLIAHAKVKRQMQYAYRARALALKQKFGPAISEAAETRYASVCAVKLPCTSRRSEGRPHQGYCGKNCSDALRNCPGVEY